MSRSIPIRRAAFEDAHAIAALYNELVADPHIRGLPENVASLSTSSNSFLLVAGTGDQVCGTALLTLCADVMYGTQPFGVVENVVVTEGMRGRGVGRALLAEVEEIALAHDCSKLMLLSSVTREEAHTFFKRCGFLSDTKRAFVKYRSQFSNPDPHP